jgi:hypothetical protein
VILAGVLLLSCYEDGVPRVAFFIKESSKIISGAIAAVAVAGRVRQFLPCAAGYAFFFVVLGQMDRRCSSQSSHVDIMVMEPFSRRHSMNNNVEP